MALRFLLVAVTTIGAHAGGSVTISSSDLASGSKPGLGNVKGSYDLDLSLPGDSKAKLSLLYDRAASADFLKEAKLAGAIQKVKYAITHTFAKKVTACTLDTTQAGVTLKASGDSTDPLKSLSGTLWGIDLALSGTL